MTLSEIRALISDDGYAITFQTMGQYRTALLRALDGEPPHAAPRPNVRGWTPMDPPGQRRQEKEA